MDERHALTVLNRLAVRNPSQSGRLEQALRGRLGSLAEAAVDVAIETGAPISQAVARLLEAERDPDLAARLARRFQDDLLGDALPLRELLLVARRITLEACRAAWREPDDVQKARLALMAHNLAISLERQGDTEGAALTLQDALDYFRELAERHPQGVRLALAKTLFNLANNLSNLNRHDEALSALRESRRIAEELVREDSSTEALAVLASALSSLGSRLSEIGRHDEAVAVSTEAIDTFRRLPSTVPASFRSGFALALERLGSRLATDGRPREALAALEQASEVQRSLVERFPEVFLPDLARNLLLLSARLAAVGRREDAARSSQEAVQIYKNLTEKQASFALEFAEGLVILGNHLADVGDHEQALVVTSEAVEIARRLAASGSASARLGLASALNAVGNRLSVFNRAEEALEAFREAVSHWRELEEEKPEDLRPRIAVGLRNLGMELRHLGERSEAVQVTREAVRLYRQLSSTLPGAYLPHLALNLNNLSLMLRDFGPPEKVLEASAEAVQLYRQLAARDAEDFRPDLAMGLHNFGVVLSDAGKREAALQVTREATELFRQLAVERPDISDSRGAFVGETQSDDGEPSAARVAADQHRLAPAHSAFELRLSQSLFNLGRRLTEHRRWGEAIDAFEESVRRLRPYFTAHPAAFGKQMQALEWSLREAMRQAGRRPQAS